MTIAAHEAGEFGMSRTGLWRAAKSGRYERIARGLYLPTDQAADWDWLEAASRRPEATLCLRSALAQHDLIDDIPDALDIALPRGTRRPASSSAIRWHLFDRDTFTLGRATISIPGAEREIGLYSPERCIADAFRLRGRVGYELGRDALREWLRRGGKPAALMAIAAELPRSKKPLLDALQVLA